MKSWLSSVLKTVLSQKLALMLTVSWVPILTLAISARDHLAQFVPQPAEQWAVLTTASSLAGILTAAGAYFWFRPKWQFDQSTGAWLDVKTNLRYCAKCKTNKVSSPLKTNFYSWSCPACGSLYPDPSRPRPVGIQPYGGGPL